MNMRISAIIFSSITALVACNPVNESKMESVDITRLKALETPAPVVEPKDHSFSHHGIEVSDPFNWIRDTDYPEVNDQPVLDYLNEENAYFDSFLKPHTKLVDTLFEEFKGRLDETESSVPFIYNEYEYRWEFAPGSNYRQYFRKNLASGEESLLLDQQAMAEGFDYFVLSDWSVSPDNKLLAYTVDTSGDERSELFVRDIASGELIGDPIKDAAGSVFFDAQSEAVLYLQLHPDVWKTKSLNYHRLNTAAAKDIVIFEEEDSGFFLGAGVSSSEEWIIISTGNSDSSEVHVVPRDKPTGELITLVSREQTVLANIDHANAYFYGLLNDEHINFRFARLSQDSLQNSQTNTGDLSTWESLITGSDEQYLEGFQNFKSGVVLSLSRAGLQAIHVMPNEGDAYDIAFPENVFSVSLGANTAFDQSFVRVNYESMITPDTVYDYSFTDKALEERKKRKIPSGYDKTQYETVRLMAPARDGVKVPVSLVYKKGLKKDASQALHLYGYGAYGSGMSPSFSTARLSMLDRGFVYAIAHVRGGDEMGYQWYLDGKLDKRENTFNDFVDVANYLIEEKYVAKGNISISGRSAGGELMGAVSIQAPELWRSVVLGVPFVDVLNTMLDATLPLTPPEWLEWGNPIESKADFELIQGYSPYDNITPREYPPMLVTGGLYDPRVTYWEPAKWTAKMRNVKTDDNLIVMRMNMGAGHFANSGRYGRLKDYAEEVAFQLVAHGIYE